MRVNLARKRLWELDPALCDLAHMDEKNYLYFYRQFEGALPEKIIG